MYRFVSTLPEAQLKCNYLAIFNIKEKEKQYKHLLNKQPQLKHFLCKDFNSIKKVLLAPFEKLANLYFSYQTFLSTLTENQKNTINEDLKEVFNYNTNRAKIANFLLDKGNGFEISNCVYCDLIRVAGYRNANHIWRREFETEHILDKGKCPLVSLSLFNFAPSCTTCNRPGIKGTKTIGRDVKESIQTSPTSSICNFDTDVRFSLVLTNENLNDLSMFQDINDLSIKIIPTHEYNKRPIELFELEERYNANLDLLIPTLNNCRMYTEDNLLLEAQTFKLPVQQVFENRFHFKYNEMIKAPMEKCRREIFECVAGYKISKYK
jgi:hypothetical protein